MKWAPILALGTSFAAVFAKEPLSANRKAFFGKSGRDSAPKKVPGVFIAEFDPNSFGKRDGRSALDAFHDHVHGLVSTVTGKPIKYKTRFEYNDQKYFSGLSFRVEHLADIHAMKTAPHVKAIYPVYKRSISRAPAVVPGQDLIDAITHKGIHKRDDGKSGANSFAPHVMIGVDKLQAANITGQNVVVGVLDTGVDTSHPMLNGGKPAGVDCFGDGCPVKGGKDFVGDDYDGENEPNPKDNPKPNCTDLAGDWGHGTVRYS